VELYLRKGSEFRENVHNGGRCAEYRTIQSCFARIACVR